MRRPVFRLLTCALLTFCLSLVPGLAPSPAAAQQSVAAANPEGVWQGAVRQPDGRDNRWVVKIEKAGTEWKGTLWFIDQKSPAIPIGKVTWNGGALGLDVELVGIQYEGRMTPDGETISGTRMAGDNKAPLVLTRATPATAWAIPEPPPPMAKMDPNADPSFEVSTIKPQAPDKREFAFLINHGSFVGRGLTLEKLMTISLTLNSAQIAGLPVWAKEEKYDIDAKPETAEAPSLKQFFGEVAKLMGDRFGLKYHVESRMMTAYALTVAKGGIRMKPSPAEAGDIPGFGLPPGQLRIMNATMKEFCGLLQSDVLDHPVVDQTGLGAVRYSGTLKYQMDDNQAIKMGMQKAPAPPDTGDVPPPLLPALAEQFGLKLESGKVPVNVYVVDSVSKPTPN